MLFPSPCEKCLRCHLFGSAHFVVLMWFLLLLFYLFNSSVSLASPLFSHSVRVFFFFYIQEILHHMEQALIQSVRIDWIAHQRRFTDAHGTISNADVARRRWPGSSRVLSLQLGAVKDKESPKRDNGPVHQLATKPPALSDRASSH